MSDTIEITNTDSPTILNCSTPGCGFHVEFDPNTLPIPALIETDKVLGMEIDKTEKVYLKCDNPVTPHINAYRIKLK
jgi:hypothetical protein